MYARRIFVLLLATVLVGRTLHCCYTEALVAALAQQTDAVQAVGAEDTDAAQRTPLRNPDDSDPNETGCICKGAVVNVPSPLRALEVAAQALNPLVTVTSVDDWTAADRQAEPIALDRHLLGPPPLGGRTLRAWIGSLLV